MAYTFFKRSLGKKDLQKKTEIDITDDSLKGIGSSISGLSNQYEQYLNTAPNDKRSAIYESVDFIDKYDEVISKLLSDMADDATQYSYQTKSPIWITSDDPKLEKELEALIETLDLKIKITNIARDLIKYGDKFGRLVIEPGKGVKRLMINNSPRSICRLEYKGELAGYKLASEVIPLQRYEMIHWKSLEEYVDDDILTVQNKALFDRYFLDERPSYGKSHIYRSISISKRLKYAEDALLLGRLSKAKLYRNHFVEVGTGTLKEKIKIMREYVRNWRKNSSVNTEDKDMYSEKNFFSHEEDVYHPVSDGKGSSNIESVGGEMDIAHIEDIEYFSGKRDKVIGVSSDSDAMTNRLQEDSKYAKKVASYQKYLLRGLYEMFDIHLDVIGKYSEERKYTINLVEVDSYVETERNEMLISSANFVEEILGLVGSIPEDKVDVDTETLVKYLFENYLRLPDLDFSEIFRTPQEPEEDIVEVDPDADAAGSEQEGEKDSGEKTPKLADPESKDDGNADGNEGKPKAPEVKKESMIESEQRRSSGIRYTENLKTKEEDDK